MYIDSFDTLVSQLSQSSDTEEVSSLLSSYGNLRETKGIESGWQRCQSIYQKRFNHRTEMMKKHVAEYDEDGMITINTFNKVFWSIFEELKTIRSEKRSIKDFQDFLFTAIGNIKVDRRLCFKKE